MGEANLVLSAGLLLALIVGEVFWPIVILAPTALAAAIACFVFALKELRRYTPPAGPIVNLITVVIVNPYSLLGYAVWLGVLDFG